MRTLSDIQEASRFGEPVTDQELRYALEACRCLLVMLHGDLAYFAADDSMTMPKVKSKSNHHWEMIKGRMRNPRRSGWARIIYRETQSLKRGPILPQK